MLDFTAIDFETANKYANSACSLAAVTMHDDICTDEAYTLIKPPFMVFSPDNIRIHGITPEQVEQKPHFDVLWEEIRPRIAGRIIVAHYAVFDTRVLRSLLKTYQLKTPDVSYACTVEISRRWKPKGYSRFRLLRHNMPNERNAPLPYALQIHPRCGQYFLGSVCCYW